MAKLRLDKIIAASLSYSRSEVKKLVSSGRVNVNGVPASSAAGKYDTDTDEVTVDGEAVRYSEFRYFIMNKPEGYLTAMEDKSQPTVMDLLPEEYANLGLSPAGRLDKDAEGLLLLTNDGAFIHFVISPKSHIYKTYLVRAAEEFEQTDVEKFACGVRLDDGYTCLAAGLEILAPCEALVRVREGKYHQVKRMCAAVGKPVVRLKRLAIGALELPEELLPGEIVEVDHALLRETVKMTNGKLC